MAWQIDTVHSNVGFSVKHMVISTVRGQFKVIGGTVDLNVDDPTKSTIEAEAEASSVDTRDDGRDNHLRSADFFEVEKYPKLTFKSTNIDSLGGNDYNITGDLTLHGVTKPVTFKGEYSGVITDPYGLPRAGITAEGKISRKEYGLAFSAAMANGGAIVGDEVKISLDVEIVNK
ncbi:MAG TPA: YceI family protein [Ktedonobacteraceae bacterium]|nr:YceI family protein [Ktedonobacteraceae bacterium]